MAVEIRRDGQTVAVQSPASTVRVSQPAYSLEVRSAVIAGGVPYGGPYEVTPSADTQVLATASCALDGDITVYPIPSNYGLITWNGSVLTVS